MLTEMCGVPAVTVTVEVADPTLPLASRYRNITVVVPTGNSVVTEASAPPVGAGSTRSDAAPAASHCARAADAEAVAPAAWVAATVMAAGAETTGGVVST